MKQNRRNFLGLAALASTSIAVPNNLFGRSQASNTEDLPKEIRDLQPQKDGVVPITIEERKQRIARAQELMAQQKIDGIFLEGATSCL
jgi:Xaa-Pro dipeptidase